MAKFADKYLGLVVGEKGLQLQIKYYKKIFFTSIVFLFFSISIFGQIETPFYGQDGYEENSIIKRDYTGIYFYATKDSSKICYISNRTVYKLFDRNYKLIVEGDLGGRCYIDNYERFGNWTEYFDNGKIKAIGSYYRNEPIGLWQYFFPNGQLQKTYSISLIETCSSSGYCMTGSYQEYYDNGQIKINGFYMASIDTATIERWEFGADDMKIVVVQKPFPKKNGIWTYYKKNGEIEKKEEYPDYR